MKIAAVVCAYPPYAGGIAGSAKQINELLEDKHEITVFTPSTIKPWLRYGHGAFLPQLLFHLKKFDYIYLHYPFFGTAEVVWLFKIFNPKVKLIIHYHMDVKQFNIFTKLLSLPGKLIRKSLLKQADLIVSASFDYLTHSQIANFFKNNKEKFREIPFALDIDKFQPKIINQITADKSLQQAQAIIHHVNDKFIKKQRLNLIFIGGLDKAHYFKGLTVLFEALFLMTNKNWRLKIIGDGDLRSNYETEARRLLLSDQIEFTGKLNNSDLLRSLQNSDVLLLPSINSNEAFGIVLIEALACGVPVIASDLPGVRSVFSNNIHGLLSKPNNVTDLKEKIEFLINHENKRQEMAKAARVLAIENYNLTLMKKRLAALFIS